MSARAEARAGRYRFRHVARMEWIKLCSLRSTWWTMALAVAAAVGIGVQTGAGSTNTEQVTRNVLAGGTLGGLLLVSVLGVLMMTSEYTSGTIRSTLAAVPRRPLLLAAKVAVFGVAALIVGEVATFASFLAAGMALKQGVVAPALSQPGVLRAVLLTGASYCLIGMLAVGLGAIIRSTAAGIVVLVGGLYVVAQLAGKLVKLASYAPLNIVQNSLSQPQQQGCSSGAGPCPHLLSAWAGLGLLCLYAVVVLAVGGLLLARRDA
jgi:ABC-2 type transport system permease protein